MKFLHRIFNIKVVAVLIGIALWYYVSITQGPLITKTFNNVPVVPINLPQETYIQNNISPISIVAEGPSKILLGLHNTDFFASVDLSGKAEGNYNLDVEVRPPTNAIKIKSYSPQKVFVAVETITSKTFTITSEFVNTPLLQQIYPSIPIITPSTTLISGPTSELEKIKRVYVQIDLSKITTATTLTLPLLVETTDASTLKNIYLNPSNVVVKLNISSSTAFITLPIIPEISSAPLFNFGIKNISVDPSVITVSGPINIISNLQSIRTQPIDASKITQSTKLDVKLAKIENITYPFDTCSVTIDVEPLVSKTFTIPVSVTTQQGKQFSLSQDNVNIVLKGFKSVIDSLQTDSIKCSIDASSLDNGSYTLPVVVLGVPQDVILETITPSSLEVRIY